MFQRLCEALQQAFPDLFVQGIFFPPEHSWENIALSPEEGKRQAIVGLASATVIFVILRSHLRFQCKLDGLQRGW